MQLLSLWSCCAFRNPFILLISTRRICLLPHQKGLLFISQLPLFFLFFFSFPERSKNKIQKGYQSIPRSRFLLSISEMASSASMQNRFKAFRREVFWYVQWTWVSCNQNTFSHLFLESPFLEIFKSHLNTVPGNHSLVALLEQRGVDQVTSRDPFQPQPSFELMGL